MHCTYETIYANSPSWSVGHFTLPALRGRPISHRTCLTTPTPSNITTITPPRHWLMICISIFVQINQNWSKRTESRMNVAPSPSQETVALLVTMHFPQKIYKCARLVPFLHNVWRLNIDPRITCNRADLVTTVAFVGLFPRVWKCVAWLSQKPWTLTNACVGSLFTQCLVAGNLLTKMVQNQWKYLKEIKGGQIPISFESCFQSDILLGQSRKGAMR